MNTLTELERRLLKRRKKALNIAVAVAVFSVVVYVGGFLAVTQIEANGAWVNECNEKYGERCWEVRDATSEERSDINHHIVFAPIPYIGQVSVCVPKEK